MNNIGLHLFTIGFSLAVLFVLGWLYFWPWLRARRAKVPTAWLIGLCNLLFGWTVLGWIACAIWADVAARRALNPPSLTNREADLALREENLALREKILRFQRGSL